MSKEYNSLNLNREILLDNIENYLSFYFSTCSVGELEEKGATRRRTQIIADDKSFYLDFHFNGNGTTTIEDFGGGNEEIKKGIARYLKENCSINSGKDDTWFVVKNIEKEDFESIIELLKDSPCYKNGYEAVIENKDNNTIYKLKGKYNESLNITYYKTKTVQVQGKTLMLFNEAVEMFTELLELDDIPKSYNKFYKVEVDKDAVRERCMIYMPNSYNKISEKLKRCLHQAVYYSLIDGKMFDYSAIPLTAFRALEGHIKYALKDAGIFTTKKTRIGDYFHKEGKSYKINSSIIDKFKKQSQIDNLEKAYNEYHRHRHIFSHWDDLDEGNSDTTLMIDNIEVARSYIQEAIQIIDSYYEL